ncbi:MAG TPA: DUF3237 domain-containing protein [Thermoanaerobaculia bacterium]|nr:DUF3237 domain-containing protein [Thermoanaerobaculia bacterium]
MTRRTFTKLWTAAAAATVAPAIIAKDPPAPAAEEAKLQSEFLLDLTIERGPSNNVGSVGVNRVVVPVVGGTFEGPRLKGTIVGPAGDWIIARPDGSSVLDIRAVLQTDDNEKIYMTARGIAYTPKGGTLFARILPVFETGSAKYSWLNNVVAVGVKRPMPGVAYRVYQIL